MMRGTKSTWDVLAAWSSNRRPFQLVMELAGLWVCLGISMKSPPPLLAADWIVGAARQEITPEQPVRLSGYASRGVTHEGIDDGLEVRAIVFRRLLADSAIQGAAEPWQVLVSVDSIGVPA